MGIDAFTFGAQVFNFLVLVALLRHFLYHPVLRTMDARDKFIAQQLQQAKEAERVAGELEQKSLQQMQEVDRVRAARLAEVKAEVDSAQQQGLARVRQEIADIGQRWRESKAREMEAWGAAESQRVAEVVLQIARGALADLATVSLEKQMIEVLLVQAEELPTGATQIATAFPLAAESQQRLLARFPGATFQLNPALVAGAVIRVNDHKIGWSVDSYLEGLAQRLQRC
jgi:F-type H+-transporting ATPase subunit b